MLLYSSNCYFLSNLQQTFPECVRFEFFLILPVWNASSINHLFNIFAAAGTLFYLHTKSLAGSPAKYQGVLIL